MCSKSSLGLFRMFHSNLYYIISVRMLYNYIIKTVYALEVLSLGYNLLMLF